MYRFDLSDLRKVHALLRLPSSGLISVTDLRLRQDETATHLKLWLVICGYGSRCNCLEPSEGEEPILDGNL